MILTPLEVAALREEWGGEAIRQCLLPASNTLPLLLTRIAYTIWMPGQVKQMSQAKLAVPYALSV